MGTRGVVGWLSVAVVLLAWPGLVGAEEKKYAKCSLDLKANDDNNLGADMTCDGVQLLSAANPIPVGTKKPVEGTPITFFPDGKFYVLSISGNSGDEGMFELESFSFSGLPASSITKDTYIILVNDARVRIRDATIDTQSLGKIGGGIHVKGDATEEAPGDAVPATGPALEIVDMNINVGQVSYAGLTMQKFPYVGVTGSSFKLGTTKTMRYIQRSGKGTLVVSRSKFTGMDNTNFATALQGATEGTVFMESTEFTDLGGAVIEWKPLKSDTTPASLHFTNCTFTHNVGKGVGDLATPLNLTMRDSRVVTSSAQSQGGVWDIKVNSPSDLLHVHLINTEFRGNSAPKGSFFYLEVLSGTDPKGEISEVKLQDCDVIKNEEGSAMHILGGGFVDVQVIGGSFKNHEGPVTGGAIGLEEVGVVTIEGTTFEANVVTGRGLEAVNPSGGAIHVEGFKAMNVSRCEFSNNKAEKTDPGLGGGALYVKAVDDPPTATLELSGTKFSNDQAGYYGGSLLVEDLASVEISGTTFTGSKTSQGPGGAAVLKNVGTITATNIHVEKSGGQKNGGGIAINTCDQVTINGGSKFLDNALANPEEGGGAIFVDSSKPCIVDIDDASFEGSTTSKTGGLLLVKGGSKCTLSSSDFKQKDNAYVVEAGGIAWMECAESLSVTSSNLIGGKTKMNGGGITYIGPKLDISKTSFSQCSADTNGGALYLDSVKDVSLNGAKFTLNSAQQNGAAVYMAGTGKEALSVEDGSFTDNHAEGSGGGISCSKVQSLKISKSEFLENSATSGGAIFADATSEVTCEASNFEKNGAGSNGGAFALTGVSDFKMESSKFTTCNAGNGGCIHATGAGSSASEPPASPGGKTNEDSAGFQITNTSFSNAHARETAGALFTKDVPSVSMESSTIDGASGNTAGGIAVESATMFSLADSVIQNCEAKGANGGALSMTSSKTLEISDCAFHSTKAKKDGGAIFLEAVEATAASTTNITESSAGGNGGGVLLLGGLATFKDCNFNHTKARQGGALAVDKDADVTLTNTNILKSKATSLDGGVVITLSCASKVALGGQCLVDIPFQTGYDGMENKEEAKNRAAMTTAPNCGTSNNIDMGCKEEIWLIGGVDALLIALYILVAIMVILLLLMVGSIAVTHEAPKDEDDVQATEATASTPMLPP